MRQFNRIGKGSKNGWSIKAPKPDPDGANKSIDISDMFPAGGGFGPNINPIRGLGGFNERVNSAVDRYKRVKEESRRKPSVKDLLPVLRRDTFGDMIITIRRDTFLLNEKKKDSNEK